MPTKNSGTDSNKLLQHYYRVVFSYSDFKHAWRCGQQLVQFGDGYNPETETLEAALYCSMVVAYARPFNSGGKSNIGKVPNLTNEILKCLTAGEKVMHDYILRCRNKFIAHTDAEFLELEPIVATDLPNNLVVPLMNDALAPFKKTYTEDFVKLCDKLVTWVVLERAKTESKVLPLLRRSKWTEIHGFDK